MSFSRRRAQNLSRRLRQKQPKQPKVTVIYGDDNMAVLYKPTHLLCHSDRTGDANLVDAFTQYLAEKVNTTPTAKTASSPASATGWTAAPRGW